MVEILKELTIQSEDSFGTLDEPQTGVTFAPIELNVFQVDETQEPVFGEGSITPKPEAGEITFSDFSTNIVDNPAVEMEKKGTRIHNPKKGTHDREIDTIKKDHNVPAGTTVGIVYIPGKGEVPARKRGNKWIPL